MIREVLLWKLSEIEILRNYFGCISVSNMYRNSSARLKLIGKISEKLDVLVGTEQGNPMSPELFKIYLLDLSDDLNLHD